VRTADAHARTTQALQVRLFRVLRRCRLDRV